VKAHKKIALIGLPIRYVKFKEEVKLQSFNEKPKHHATGRKWTDRKQRWR
jgi:hypothetical protein